MDEQRFKAYLKLIKALLGCPSGEEIEILQNHRELVDRGLVQVMLRFAAKSKELGRTDNADFLMNLVGRIREGIEESPVLPPAPKFSPEQLDLNYCYLDLEVNSEGNIYRIGVESPDFSKDATSEDFDTFYQQLTDLKLKNFSICGHNFRRFDYSYLIKQQPELHPWLVIDTLELSVLAKPLELSHKLSKEYKPSQYARNNPLEDARATKRLLHESVETLLKKPRSLQKTYAWLLTCGTEEADQAYKQLFSTLGLEVKEAPTLETLPPEAIAEFDRPYLQGFWTHSTTKNFDSRLCMAALLAWNYERRVTNSADAFPRWLTHLSGFQNILNDLSPLILEGFTYHPYLNEFGISNFRGRQEESVQAILEGHNPLVVMATGGGKSLCYQLPALMLHERQRALTVVISPLQALMADQVADLKAVGLNFATYINSSLSKLERLRRLEELYKGLRGLLYISPEQLRSISIITLLQERPPALWVIDEAHCITQWGHNFRPDYRYIPKFIRELYDERQLPLPPLALMTATATAAVRNDIKQLFADSGLSINREILSSSFRENLEYKIIPTYSNKTKEPILLSEVRQALEQGGGTLVYTTTKKNAEKLANLLNREKIAARHYHSGISREEKEDILQAFKTGELNVVTATCAFGMGINRKDVRAVIHHTMSSNLENYAQESGRAGRDGKPATCTLLFDERDTDVIFFLQSLSQPSQTELANIFTSTRAIRDRLKASEDWFWVTPHEIYQSSDLEEMAPDQRDTKIKVALYNLETFRMLKRAENLSTFIKFQLLHRSLHESYQQFEQYSQQHNLPDSQIEQFKRLIDVMHVLKVRSHQEDAYCPLEQLSDESGIEPKELRSRIQELQQAGVCSFEIPLALLVTKGVTGDARKHHESLRTLEQELLEALLEIKGEGDSVQVNLRGLASRLDPDGSKKTNASALMDILDGWASESWVSIKHIGDHVVKLSEIKVLENLERHKTLASSIIEVLYEKLGSKKGALLRVEYQIGQLLKDVTERSQPLIWSSEELEAVLLWLHERKILRLTEGLNLFQQAFKVQVIKSVKITTISRRYPEIQSRYYEQARRTHIMMKYGSMPDKTAREQLIEDYFRRSPNEFNEVYPELATEEVKRPVTQDDYNSIIEPLNSTQRAIVLAQEPALAVIAGPGSGKTRTIVHRIAYLVKVKRVDPARILVLAYNRNAVGELRLRLQTLVGSLASRLRVFTFHGLALALLGRSLGQLRREQNQVDFKALLQEACKLFEPTDELEDEDVDAQARRIRLLGNLEYIFVDEYQDVAEDEYRLIQRIAGLGESEDESRSVQINLCVIGDDDQNVYEFRGTSPEYIIQFEGKYSAKRALLTENYRSTEPIIEAANNLIRNNKQRCKKTLEEQVRINSDRQGIGGLPVSAFTFSGRDTLSGWVTQKILSWIGEGIRANDIAVLAREWDALGPIRLLLEKENIATYALKRDGINLVRNRVTSHLINALQKNRSIVLEATESVESRFRDFFKRSQRHIEEPTVKTLLKIASDIDRERGYGSEELAVPISTDEILTAIFEFSASGEVFLEENAVLVTSCHGAKGLEFRKVILLTDNFNINESERRLFYVAMTRAKEELVLCSTRHNQFLQETNLSSQPINQAAQQLPQRMLYQDLDPGSVNLGYRATRSQQEVIKTLHEGAPLQIIANRYGNGWVILTEQGQEIGALSRRTNEELERRGIQPGRFQFQPGEVTVRSIFHQFDLDDVTGEITDDWFVVIPQIRICR